ncbi:MAG: bifunctional 4-hydroxy-2-oxoglutarate aldolase/2-dehydro-3-deoxy-phosphogluconate aldolase [Armatimonadetes bacterium]|nr:bifunctional 4-hydroxy-2-oxoglutarate aldolase/2-dehydro-3-deoxy-phosphogluconate aldolase [Armatimonadota bacterium]
MNKSEVIERIHAEWLGMIMRGEAAEQTLATCEAIIAAGAKVVEVAFTTPDVCSALRELRRRYEEDIVLAAGMVRTPEQAQMAIDEGAQVIVSPNLSAPVVETAVRNGVVSMPGCVTPTEIGEALNLGADLIKLFPCYQVGPEYIGYIRAPFPEVRIVPAGKVTLDNMPDYYQNGAFAAVVGVTTEMQMLRAVACGSWNEVTAAARHWIARAKEMKQ